MSRLKQWDLVWGVAYGLQGLGLSIASDIALSHGGALRLSKSETLGGLRVDLVIPR